MKLFLHFEGSSVSAAYDEDLVKIGDGTHEGAYFRVPAAGGIHAVIERVDGGFQIVNILATLIRDGRRILCVTQRLEHGDIVEVRGRKIRVGIGARYEESAPESAPETATDAPPTDSAAATATAPDCAPESATSAEVETDQSAPKSATVVEQSAAETATDAPTDAPTTDSAAATATVRPSPGELLVWLDLETTGLDPEKDRILEYAIVITRRDFGPLPYDPPNACAQHILSPLHPEDLIPDPVVRKMHEDSGLLKEICISPDRFDAEVSLANFTHTMERMALEFLRSWGFTPGTARLAGFGPHFDLAFLKVHAPALARMFHYRLFDVTALIEADAMWRDPDIRERFKKIASEHPKHRAMGDCLAAASVASFYRDGWRNDPPGEIVEVTPEQKKATEERKAQDRFTKSALASLLAIGGMYGALYGTPKDEEE